MLERILIRIDKIEEKVTDTHSEVTKINGKVRTNTKLIYTTAGAFGAAFLALVGWLIRIVT